mgnify:CR=1 FL=1
MTIALWRAAVADRFDHDTARVEELTKCVSEGPQASSLLGTHAVVHCLFLCYFTACVAFVTVKGRVSLAQRQSPEERIQIHASNRTGTKGTAKHQ